MRTFIFWLIVLFLAFTFNITTGFAQDVSQLSLSEGARARLGKGTVNQITYSPDGSQLAVAGSIGIWLYDTVTFQEVALLAGYTGSVGSVSFSPDGRTLASGSWDGTVLLWQLTPIPPTMTFTPNNFPDQTFTAGTSVYLTLPIATGGTAPYTYTLSPIPAGLHFDTTTQVLRGTPTTVGATAATYTATDTMGASAALTFTIAVIRWTRN